MKRQLEIVCLIVWVVILCIAFAKNVPAAEPLPTQTISSEQFVCILTGGKWVNNACVKPARPVPTTPVSDCNPLVCMITYRGKCIDGKCVTQEGATMPTTHPKH